MSILDRVSPLMPPHDHGRKLSESNGSPAIRRMNGIGKAAGGETHGKKGNAPTQSSRRQEMRQTYSDFAIDPFISQYIRSPHFNTPFNYHTVFFESVKNDVNNQLFDLFQKYFIRNKDTPKAKEEYAKPCRVENQLKVDEPTTHVPVAKAKLHVPFPSSGPSADASPSKSETRTLPKNFIECDLDDLIDLISRLLRSLIALNDKNVHPSISNPQKGSKTTNHILTRYHSRTPPAISAQTYLSRLARFNNLNPGTLLTTIYYIDLLSHHYQPFFTLNSWTVHRFLLVATTLSQKLLEDFFYTNEHYAKVGGVAVSELNCLELDFLERVDWRCVPGKVGENNLFSIKYAKTILDMYYAQLVSLMGQPSQDSSIIRYTLQDSEAHVLDDGSIDDIFDEDEGEEDGMQDDGAESSLPEDRRFYDRLGYSVDGSSSPHLKRRYSTNFES